jgi:aminocarboxymuconate-semialdehyde decarboxylase
MLLPPKAQQFSVRVCGGGLTESAWMNPSAEAADPSRPRGAAAPGGAIDFHAHWWPSDLLDLMSELESSVGLQAKWMPPPEISRADDVFELEARIALMNEAGIAVQVLSGSNVGHDDASIAADLHRCNNDGLSEGCRAHPGRFRFLASLPLPFMDESLAEATRAAALPEFAGFVLPTHVYGAALDTDALLPLLEHLDEHRRVVSMHPDGFRAPGLLSDWLMDWSIGAPFEDTIAVIRLISSGRLEQFPQIRWLVPHLGGCLPVLVQRMDRMWPAFREALGTAAPISRYLGGLHFDTAASSAETLELATTVMEPPGFVLGTDFPFVERQNMRPAVDRVRECATLGAAQADHILGGAALIA